MSYEEGLMSLQLLGEERVGKARRAKADEQEQEFQSGLSALKREAP